MNKDNRSTALIPVVSRALSTRAALVSRGLQEILREDIPENMESWLEKLPEGRSFLLSLKFLDGRELLNREQLDFNPKQPSAMSLEEMRRELLESYGLPNREVFEEEITGSVYAGYLELEGVKPIERSKLKVEQPVEEEKRNGNMYPIKHMILTAVAIVLQRLLAQQTSLRLYHPYDTTFGFRCRDLESLHKFIDEANAELGMIALKIKKPDQTIVERVADLRLSLPRFRKQSE